MTTRSPPMLDDYHGNGPNVAGGKNGRAARETVIIYRPGSRTTDDSTSVYHGNMPANTRIIGVNPSSACSLHDRIMQSCRSFMKSKAALRILGQAPRGTMAMRPNALTVEDCMRNGMKTIWFISLAIHSRG